jgi:hypothetical protein
MLLAVSAAGCACFYVITHSGAVPPTGLNIEVVQVALSAPTSARDWSFARIHNASQRQTVRVVHNITGHRCALELRAQTLHS